MPDRARLMEPLGEFPRNRCWRVPLIYRFAYEQVPVAIWVNSKALEVAGVDRDTVAPEGAILDTDRR